MEDRVGLFVSGASHPYVKGVPGQPFAYQAVASVMGNKRAVSVPLGITTPDYSGEANDNFDVAEPFRFIPAAPS